jgi:hypothetical protein
MIARIPYEVTDYLPKLRHAIAENDLESIDFYLYGFVKELNHYREVGLKEHVPTSLSLGKHDQSRV